jgi:hypothetical protein
LLVTTACPVSEIGFRMPDDSGTLDTVQNRSDIIIG